MRRRIRLSESDLHRVIRESVKRVLRETHRKSRRNSIYESFGGNDIEILQQNGLNPQMVQKLVSPQQVPVYNSDSDGPEWTNDFGISADNGDIRVWVNGAEVNELGDGLAVETIEDMCHELNSGASVESIWYDLTRNWSL